MNNVCLKLRFVGLGGSPTPKLHSSAPLPPPPSYRRITSFFVSCKCCINLCPFFNRLVVVVVLKNDVVVQTKKHSEVKQETQESSTISRYSCRSLVDREPSHTAYVFAAGFDKSNNIFLRVRKPAICLYLRHRIILSHVTALKGRLLPNDNVVEHIYIH